MKIAYTRAMVRAALDGDLAGVPTKQDPIFGLHIPTSVPNVPVEVLTPRNTWSDKDAYDAKARELAARFKKNFEQFASQATNAVSQAGPV
jgi:phosphoenolpyruvate carboxykinase (ATP)